MIRRSSGRARVLRRSVIGFLAASGAAATLLGCAGEEFECRPRTGFELIIEAPTEDYLDYFGTLSLGADEHPVQIECRRSQFFAEDAEDAEARCAERKFSYAVGFAVASLELQEETGRFAYRGPLDVSILQETDHPQRHCASRVYGATARLEPLGE